MLEIQYLKEASVALEARVKTNIESKNRSVFE